MPHLVVLYTARLEAQADMGGLCRALADTMRGCQDDAGRPTFPVAGVRVLAFPAAHHAVADGSQDFGFIYLHLRMGRGRSAATVQRAGEALVSSAGQHLATLLAGQLCGVTLQIDEGPEVFDAKFGNLHAHFSPPP